MGGFEFEKREHMNNLRMCSSRLWMDVRNDSGEALRGAKFIEMGEE